MRVRPIQLADADALLALALGSGVGVTTLPSNPERLGQRIQASQASCGTTAPALADGSYLFVLEDETCNAVVGSCGIEAAVGLREPWYNYRCGLAVHAASELGIYRRLNTLYLSSDLTGSAELCSLFLHPNWRRERNGALLSKSRLLFLAEFPERFSHRVIAELRGVADEAGRSPFWESLGRHFFTMDFSRADYLSGVGNKAFIAELMPRHPLYTVMLSEAAQAAIGEVHANTRPARALLESEGFRFNGYVDIFDAGPTLETHLSQIRAVRESQILSATCGPVSPDAPLCLLSNRRLAEFRACVAPGECRGGELCLDGATLRRLELQVGESLRAVPLAAHSHRPRADTTR